MNHGQCKDVGVKCEVVQFQAQGLLKLSFAEGDVTSLRPDLSIAARSPYLQRYPTSYMS